MLDFIKLFLEGNPSFSKKISILALIAITAITIDRFTTFPSVAFEQSRYETIQKLHGIEKDSTLPKIVRDKINQRIVQLSTRKSFTEFIDAFLLRLSEQAKQISAIVPVPFLSWLLFALFSSGYFILITITGIYSMNNLILISKFRLIITMLAIIITAIILSFLVTSIFHLHSLIILWSLLTQAGFIIFLVWSAYPFDMFMNIIETKEEK